MTRRPRPGQVWQHRHACLICSATRGQPAQAFHRYVVLEVDEHSVMVRDLAINTDRQQGDPYRLPIEQFGSMAAGGLGLVGRLAGTRVVPARRPDTRARPVDRVSPVRGGAFRIAGASRAA